MRVSYVVVKISSYKVGAAFVIVVNESLRIARAALAPNGDSFNSPLFRRDHAHCQAILAWQNELGASSYEYRLSCCAAISTILPRRLTYSA
jgi:hypothetical protein